MSTGFSLSMEMSRLARNGTAETVSRDQNLRRECGQGNVNFSFSADQVQGWQPYPLDPYSCYMCDHIYVCNPTVQYKDLAYYYCIIHAPAPVLLIDNSSFFSKASFLQCSNDITIHHRAKNKVAKKMGTYFEIGTDAHRFVCFQSGISIPRRYLRGVSVYIER